MIVRYNNDIRHYLDGTIDFYTYHVPLLEHFGMWFLQKPMHIIKTYFGDFDTYRTLHIFSCNKL
jgi:hypothetical protein